MSAPDWHDEARRLLGQGLSVRATAKAVAKAETTVRFALDINGARTKQVAQNGRRRRKATERASYQTGGTGNVVRPGFRPKSQAERDDRAAALSYCREVVERPLTLAPVSLPPLADEPGVFRFAPSTRDVPDQSPGVERIRRIHRDMIRSGRIPGRDLVSEWLQ